MTPKELTLLGVIPCTSDTSAFILPTVNGDKKLRLVGDAAKAQERNMQVIKQVCEN